MQGTLVRVRARKPERRRRGAPPSDSDGRLKTPPDGWAPPAGPTGQRLRAAGGAAARVSWAAAHSGKGGGARGAGPRVGPSGGSPFFSFF